MCLFCRRLVKIVNINNHALIFGESDRNHFCLSGFFRLSFASWPTNNTGQIFWPHFYQPHRAGPWRSAARQKTKKEILLGRGAFHPVCSMQGKHNCSRVVLYLNNRKTGCSKRAQWRPAAQNNRDIRLVPRICTKQMSLHAKSGRNTWRGACRRMHDAGSHAGESRLVPMCWQEAASCRLQKKTFQAGSSRIWDAKQDCILLASRFLFVTFSVSRFPARRVAYQGRSHLTAVMLAVADDVPAVANASGQIYFVRFEASPSFPQLPLQGRLCLCLCL